MDMLSEWVRARSSVSSTPLPESPEQLPNGYMRTPKKTCDISRLTVLVIAKSDEEGERPLKGPELDTDYIREEFSRLPNISIESISDSNATLNGVDKAIERVWRAAHDGSHLLFFLTGHGSNQGMILAGDAHIDEQHIRERLYDLNVTYRKDLWVTIVFDICRNEVYLHSEPIETNKRISTIWSCSIGQKAGSLGFKPPILRHPLDVVYYMLRSWWLSWWHPPEKHTFYPGSFFLLAAVKTYQDVCEGKGSLEVRLSVRYTQLARYDSYCHHIASTGNGTGCGICIRDTVWCPDAFILPKEFERVIDLRRYRGNLDYLMAFLQQGGYDASLPDVVSRFFLKLDAFDKRSKYSCQAAYMLRNPHDVRVWWGWLKWLIWPGLALWTSDCWQKFQVRLSDPSYRTKAKAGFGSERAQSVDQA